MDPQGTEDDVVDEDYLRKRHIDCQATSLSIVIDSSRTSLLGLHEAMPHLTCLILDGSSILSLRDLGTKLGHLTALYVNECGLTDLDGIGAFPNLKELSICGNEISDLSCLAMHTSLEVSDFVLQLLFNLFQYSRL